MARKSPSSRPATSAAPWWTPARQNLLIVAGLVVLVLAVYGQMARGVFSPLNRIWPGQQFQFIGLDDGDYIFQNRYIKQGLTGESVAWAFTENFSANWHPLTWISLMLDVDLYGLHPGGPHVTNLLLHLGNVLLLFFVVWRMTDARWMSALIAAVFAVHPLHVESVAWVSERKDVLSTFFALLALGAYVGYSRRPGVGRYLLVAGCYVLSLFSKQMWVTFPCVLLLLDFWPLKRLRIGTSTEIEGQGKFAAASAVRLVLEKIPFFALAFGFAAMIFIVQRSAGAMSSLDNLPIHRRLPIAISSYWVYIYQTFVPTRLGVMYPINPPDSLWTTKVLLTAGLLLAITALAVWKWKRWPWFAVGWFWYLGTLVPVIGLVQVGSQAHADRYAYVPHIGLFLALAWCWLAGYAWLKANTSAGFATGLAATSALAIVLALSVRCYHQVALWQNTELLFEHTVAITEKNYGMAVTLASYLANGDRLDDAKKYYKMALLMDPHRIEAMVGCAICIMNNNGKLEEAIMLLERAQKIDLNDEMTMIQLGTAYINKGDYKKGIGYIARVSKTGKKASMASAALGMAEMRRGNLAKAERHLLDAALKDRTDPFYLRVLSSFYLAAGVFPKAEELLHQVLRYAPNDLAAQLDMGALLIRKGRIEEATRMFEQCVQARPGNADAHNRYAAALMAQGRIGEAMTEFETAIRLRPDWATPFNDLAWTLATDEAPSARHGARAVALAERACEITEWEDPAMIDTLAAAYAEAGRWSDALKTANKAIVVAKEKNENLVPGIQSRLALYENRQPVRMSSRSAAEAVREKPEPASDTAT